MTMMMTTDPAARPWGAWRAELGSLKARGADEDDARVQAARSALAYWRVRRAIDAEAGRLSAAGVDALIAKLLGVAR